MKSGQLAAARASSEMGHEPHHILEEELGLVSHMEN